MNAQFFLFYLRFRKLIPAISPRRGACAIAFASLSIVALNQYQNYQATIVREPWLIEDVLSGNSFTVRRGNETKTVTLCGIISKERDYLQSLIDRGNGSVYLQKSHSDYEAWILLESPQEVQIHLNTKMLEDKKATLNNHQHCLSSENLQWASQLID